MTLASETRAERDLRRLRTMYRALGDETRLRVISLLAEFGPMPVNELSARVSLSQPLISWHLRILRKAQVIRTRRDGREVFCRLDREAIATHFKSFARLIAVAGVPAELTTSTTPVHEGAS